MEDIYSQMYFLKSKDIPAGRTPAKSSNPQVGNEGSVPPSTWTENDPPLPLYTPTSAQPLGPCGSSNKLWRPGPSSPSKKDLPEGSQSCQHPWSQEMFPVATEAGPGDQGEFLGGCWLGRVVGSLWGHHCPQQGETGATE